MPLKFRGFGLTGQVLSASRDVIISGQICGSKLQKVFTLGDRCWLAHSKALRARLLESEMFAETFSLCIELGDRDMGGSKRTER